MSTTTLRDPVSILREDYRVVRRWRESVEGWSDDALRLEDARMASMIERRDAIAIRLRAMTFAVLAERVRRHESIHGSSPSLTHEGTSSSVFF